MDEKASMHKNTQYRFFATLTFVGTVAVNALANILPINGLSTRQVSDLYPSLFTPTGLTFSIWTVIYLLLCGFVILIWFRKKDAVVNTILPWFILSCIFNMTWIVLWHYLFPGLSVIVMLALLGTLTVMFKVVHIHPFNKLTDKIFLMLPFTLYLAWICVATIANISALLVSIDWSGGFLSTDAWTVVMMCVAALLAFKITVDFKVPFFSAVVIWALLGIHLRWRGGEHKIIFYSSLMLITALAMVLLYSWKKKGTV